MMAQQVVKLSCPGCGAPVSTDQSTCEWCHGPIVISTFNSVYSMPMPKVNKYVSAYNKALAENPDNTALHVSVAMCFLKLKQYDKALAAFEKAMEEDFDNSETYFYAAICLLGGKRPFQAGKANVDRALSYLDSAVMIEPRGIYYYLMAYLKYDYYYLKKLRTSPNYGECLQAAQQAGGVANGDVSLLTQVLGYQPVIN